MNVADKESKKAPVPPLPWWATLLLWLVFGRGGGDGK